MKESKGRITRAWRAYLKASAEAHAVYDKANAEAKAVYDKTEHEAWNTFFNSKGTAGGSPRPADRGCGEGN